jgi:YD repeat-containing protein
MLSHAWNSAPTFTYRADGRVDTITPTNGITTTHGYDPAGRLVTIADTNPSGATVASFAYTLDAEGNRTSQTATIGGAPSVTETYTLDPLNRLTATTTGGGTDTWAYDPAGNRTQQTTASGVTAYAYDNAQALASTTNPDGSTTTYTHDANGNLTATSTGDTYTYNHDNQITPKARRPAPRWPWPSSLASMGQDRAVHAAMTRAASIRTCPADPGTRSTTCRRTPLPVPPRGMGSLSV